MKTKTNLKAGVYLGLTVSAGMGSQVANG